MSHSTDRKAAELRARAHRLRRNARLVDDPATVSAILELATSLDERASDLEQVEKHNSKPQ